MCYELHELYRDYRRKRQVGQIANLPYHIFRKTNIELCPPKPCMADMTTLRDETGRATFGTLSIAHYRSGVRLLIVGWITSNEQVERASPEASGAR